MLIRLIVFLICSAAIVYRSWPSLRDPRSHGFFRFFAFEIILLLVLLNAGRWFYQPFSPAQIVSWVFLLASILLALHGFYLLHKIGQPEGDFESTTRLVVEGAYRYIRHPLYASLLCVGVGAFMKDPSLTGGAMLIALLAFLTATARVEEVENLERFGEAYAAYMQQTKMFIPFIF